MYSIYRFITDLCTMHCQTMRWEKKAISEFIDWEILISHEIALTGEGVNKVFYTEKIKQYYFASAADVLGTLGGQYHTMGQFLISFAPKHSPLHLARLPEDKDLLQSFNVPGAIHRILYVWKPCLLELWRPGRDGMPLCMLRLVVWGIEEGAGQHRVGREEPSFSGWNDCSSF